MGCRTFMVNPPEKMQKDYGFLLEVFDILTNKLQDGVKLSTVYEELASHVKSKRSDLVEKFSKGAGFGMGIEFRESSMVIGPKTTLKAVKNMHFSLVIQWLLMMDNQLLFSHLQVKRN